MGLSDENRRRWPSEPLAQNLTEGDAVDAERHAFEEARRPLPVDGDDAVALAAQPQPNILEDPQGLAEAPAQDVLLADHGRPPEPRGEPVVVEGGDVGRHAVPAARDHHEGLSRVAIVLGTEIEKRLGKDHTRGPDRAALAVRIGVEGRGRNPALDEKGALSVVEAAGVGEKLLRDLVPGERGAQAGLRRAAGGASIALHFDTASVSGCKTADRARHRPACPSSSLSTNSVPGRGVVPPRRVFRF